MKKLTVLIMIFMFGFIGNANATMMIFDDINVDGPYGWGEISSYQGFNFYHAGIVELDEYHHPSGYRNGVISLHNVLYSHRTHTLTISNTSIFDLNSAYFTSAWMDGMTVEVTGYLNGIEINYFEFLVNTQTPLFVEFDWIGIDSIDFARYGGTYHSQYYSGHGDNIAIDNLIYNETQTAPVPEPATILLMGIGLMGIIGYQYKGKLK